jgi:pilus assembly protein CpaB
MLGLSGARAVVLGIALLAGLGAYMLSGSAPPPVAPVIVQQPVQARTVDVLVARYDIGLGEVITDANTQWIPWPDNSVPQGALRRSEAAALEREVFGAMARASFVANEPMRREKLIRADGSGFLSAILPQGRRAVAINIDSRGATTAGGFILPNDRVDIIKTGRQEGAGQDAFASETILTNVRVLAIGQKVQEQANGEKVVVGETATLELDPRQVETVTLAQKSGSLSLSLRSLADAREVVPQETTDRQNGLTIVRFGVTTQSARQ